MGETLTNINKLRNPNYLGSWDFEDKNGNIQDLILTISKIEQGEAWESKTNSMKPVLTVHFVEKVKPIILNATNTKMIQSVTESKYVEPMVGKKIQLTVKKVKMGREMVDGIRIVNKLSSQLVSSQATSPALPPVIVVDEKLCIEKLNRAVNLEELGIVWNLLTQEEKKNAAVLKTKEDLKIKYSNGGTL